jgi:hypothetical protein
MKENGRAIDVRQQAVATRLFQRADSANTFQYGKLRRFPNPNSIWHDDDEDLFMEESKMQYVVPMLRSFLRPAAGYCGTGSGATGFTYNFDICQPGASTETCGSGTSPSATMTVGCQNGDAPSTADSSWCEDGTADAGLIFTATCNDGHTA